jgi:hypothetical protein
MPLGNMGQTENSTSFGQGQAASPVTARPRAEWGGKKAVPLPLPHAPSFHFFIITITYINYI